MKQYLPLFLVTLACLLIVAPGAQARHHSDSATNSTSPPPIPPPLNGGNSFTCPSGEVVQDQSQCPQQTFTCPTGEVVTNLSDCPSVPSGASSSGGSSSSSHHGGSSKPIESLPIRMNISKFVESCFINKTINNINITTDNASQIIDQCFFSFQHHTTSAAHISHTHPIISILQGQVVAAPQKTVTTKHTKSFMIGFREGKQDGLLSGVRDPAGNCNSAQGVFGNIETNQCMSGYNQSFNTYCKTGKYGCKD